MERIMPIKLLESADGAVTIFVKVVPGSSRDRIVGPLGDELKIAVSAPPTGGAANKAVLELLASTLGIPKRNVELISGPANARKQIRVRGCPVSILRQKLA